jgi:MSHA biogenesis protein MshI
VGQAADRAAVLGRAVHDLGARGLPVVANLQHAAYSLVQLEAPELEPEELREAMRWRVRDLIDFPIEQAVIDIVHLPPSRRPGAPALLYVVVAKAPEVDALAEMLIDAGLDIQAIDIVEMAIRNLSLHLDQPARPRAYLHLQPGQTVIEIADGSQVYLSRRVLQDVDAGADVALLEAQMENLALEVQRSLDYFESQFAVGAVDMLSVMVCNEGLFSVFSSVARAFLTVPTERFAFDRMATADGVELSVLGRGVTAVGAALRGLAWTA